jgi:hypothetical protein
MHHVLSIPPMTSPMARMVRFCTRSRKYTRATHRSATCCIMIRNLRGRTNRRLGTAKALWLGTRHQLFGLSTRSPNILPGWLTALLPSTIPKRSMGSPHCASPPRWQDCQPLATSSSTMSRNSTTPICQTGRLIVL